MEILLKLTIPDSDVTIAQENACGLNEDLAQWFVRHFTADNCEYFTDNLGFGFKIEAI